MSYTKTMYKEQILDPVINITQKSLEDNDFSPILDKINIAIDMLEGISSINPKVGEIWNEISSDIISSIYSATSGFYRQAILSLRSVLELGCSSFFYIDHKVEHEMFIQFNTKADKYVSSLVRDYAFFTTQYISAFYGEISKIETERDSISTYLKGLYGDLSDIVHGRYNTLTKKQSLKIKYSKQEFRSYVKFLDRVLSILCTMYFLRINNTQEDIIKLARISRTVKI